MYKRNETIQTNYDKGGMKSFYSHDLNYILMKDQANLEATKKLVIYSVTSTLHTVPTVNNG